MSLIIMTVDEVRRTLSASGGAFVVHDKEVDIVRFAINSGFADIVLDGQVALRVMYQRPGETQVRAQTLTYYDTDGLRNYYDWQLSQSDLAKNGSLMVALCILDISGGEVSEWHTTPCAVRVLSTIHTDDSDEGDDTITPTVKERVAVLESMIQRVASGAPIVVSSTSGMTDTDQIYVLKTDGQWYYHDGSTWVAGGEYGGVAAGSITTDKLANKSVTTAKISDGAVTAEKIANDLIPAIISENNVKKNIYQIASGWKLQSSGYSVANQNYQLVKYAVTALSAIFVYSSDTDVIMQFQSAPGVSSSGTQTIIGTVITGGYIGTLEVPEGANYLIISSKSDDADTGLYDLIAEINSIKSDSISGIFSKQISDNAYIIPIEWESGTWDDSVKGGGRTNSKRLRSKKYLHSPTSELRILSNRSTLNWFILEFDENLHYVKSSGSWSVGTSYSLSNPFFKIVIRKPNDTDMAVADANGFIIAISDKKTYGIDFMQVSPDAVANNYYLTADGLAKSSSSGTNIHKYNIAGVDYVSIISNSVYQFQSSAYIPGSGTNNGLVGEVVTNPTADKIAVPDGATWLMINVESTDVYSGIYLKETKKLHNNSTVCPDPRLYTTRYIGHRGGGKTAPENTLPAFEQGYENGFRGFEFDIQFTSDDVPVLLHDETINGVARNSDGTQIAETVYINDITYEQALTYDFGIRLGQTYAGTKIPTLDQVLIWMKSHDSIGEIDISGTANFTDARAKIIYDLVKKRGMAGKTFFTANQTKLQQVAKNGKDICVCVSNSGTSESALSSASVMNDVSMLTFCSVQYPYLTENQVNFVHTYGMMAKAFTLNTTEGIETVVGYGIDCMILHNIYPNELT